MKVINLQDGGNRNEIDKIKQGISLFADVLSVKMKQKTKEVFGKQLSPLESVKHIVDDVRENGERDLK